MPLFYLAAGFLGGYLVGRRHGVLAVMRREATSILDSVGRLSNLHTMEDLRFKSGSDKDGEIVKQYVAAQRGSSPP